MSTIKVNSIESATGGGVDAKIASVNSGSIGNRNLIINGAMKFAQRGTSATGKTGSGIYATDRMLADIGSAGTWTISQDSDCLLYTSPSPRDRTRSRMPSSA